MTRAIAKKVFGLRIQRLKVRVLQGVPARANRPIWSEIWQTSQLLGFTRLFFWSGAVRCGRPRSVKFSRFILYTGAPGTQRLGELSGCQLGGGRHVPSYRLWGGCSKIGWKDRFWRFLRPVVAAAAEKPKELGHRRKSDQLLLEAFTALGARRVGSSAGAYCGHGRGVGGFGLVSVDRSTILQPGQCHLQRRGGSGSYFTESLHSWGGTFAQKSITKRPAKNNQLFGLFSTFGGGDGSKKSDLLGLVFDGCASRRGGWPKLGRLGQVASALGRFVCASPVSYGAGTGRRRHKDGCTKGVTGSPVFGGGFVVLAFAVSEDDRLFSSRRKSYFCDRNQTAALAGGFFEKSIQARLEKSRLAGEPYSARLQTQLYHSRFSGRREFANRPKNYTPKPEGYSRPVHTPKLGRFLRGGEFNQTKRASQSPLRGQLDHKN